MTNFITKTLTSYFRAIYFIPLKVRDAARPKALAKTDRDSLVQTVSNL